MFNDIKKYLSHYIFLIAIMLLGFGSFFLVGYDHSLQIKITILISLSYFCWGLIHHLLKDDLHIRVVVEYLLISTLAFLILFTLIQRA